VQGRPLTVAPIQAMIQDSGFQATFLYFGLGQRHRHRDPGILLIAPKAGQVPAMVQNANLLQNAAQLSADRSDPLSDLLADVFHVRHRGRRRIDGDGHLKPIAVDWKVDSIPVTLIG